ncbi:MAG TPA: amidinotransferase [Micromonospora sp.]|nr:amidinotransferase [Micromonospora sp.]
MVSVNQQRMSRKRTYILCPPEYFSVNYAINPWMDTSTPVDAGLALKQWDHLRNVLIGLGHDVHVLAPQVGLPDMVYAANGAFVVDGTAYGARFKYPQRADEAAAHRAFYEAAGWRFVAPAAVNEGEGDFAYLPDAYGGLILAGHGFRTELPAHAEAQEVLARPVVSLRLVDPRFYHLDTALAALDDRNITYYPAAFSTASQRVLAQLFPDAVLADETDAVAFGLNLVSDGRNVFINSEATGLAAKLEAAGYVSVPVDLSELKKGGGSVKCCVAELRP